MGAVNIWNAMEVADDARENPNLCSDIQSSSLTIDHSLSLPDMKPRLMFVKLLSLSDTHFYLFASLAFFLF